MGMLDSYGQGANLAAENFMKAFNAGKDRSLERDKLAQQKAIQDAQIQEFLAQAAERKRNTDNETAMRGELSALYAPQPEMGMMSTGGPQVPDGAFSVNPALDMPKATGRMIPGQPSLDSYLNVLGKYKPEQALTAQVSMRNNEERLKSQKEINDVRTQAAVDMLGQKHEQALKLFELTSDMKYKQAADKSAGEMALLMERLQGLKDIQGMKTGDKKAPTLKFQNDYTKASSKREELISQMDDIDANADRLLKTNLGRITGVVGAFPSIPGTEAADAKAALDSFKSKLGLTTLAALKSGTGAGLGQVTEAEHKLLQNFISELDQAQSEQSLRASIDRIKKWAAGAKGRIDAGYSKSIYGKYDREQNGENETPSTAPTGKVSGATIKYDANGNRVK